MSKNGRYKLFYHNKFFFCLICALCYYKVFRDDLVDVSLKKVYLKWVMIDQYHGKGLKNNSGLKGETNEQLLSLSLF